MSLSALTRAVSDLNKSSVTVKKYTVTAKEEIKQKLANKLNEIEGEIGDNQIGLKTLQRIREEVYGL
jgi:hypothetical protein